MRQRIRAGLLVCLCAFAVLSMGGCPTVSEVITYLSGRLISVDPVETPDTVEITCMAKAVDTAPGEGIVHLTCGVVGEEDSAEAVVADLSGLGGPAQQALTQEHENTWTWTGFLTQMFGLDPKIPVTVTTAAGNAYVRQVPLTWLTEPAAKDNFVPKVSSATIEFDGPAIAGQPLQVTIQCTATDPDGMVQTVVAVDRNGSTMAVTDTGRTLAEGLALTEGADHVWSWTGTITFYRVGYGDLVVKATDEDGLVGGTSLSYKILEGEQEPSEVLKWSADTGGQVASCAAIDGDGNLYIAGNYQDLCAFRSDGHSLWTYGVGSTYAAPAMASDGTLYLSSFNMYLEAITPQGSGKWTFKGLLGSLDIIPMAIGFDGTIYASDYGIHAITPSGQLQWKCPIDNYVSAAAVGTDGTIYAGSSDGKLYAIRPNGQLAWACTLVANNARSNTFSPPAIGADGTIYIAASKLYAVHSNGELAWEYPAGSHFWSSPAIAADGTIYVGSEDHNLHAVNPDGTVKWTYATAMAVRSSPTIAADGTVYVGSDDTYVHAINADGTRKWVYKTQDCVRSSPAIAPDGTVYVGSFDGRVYALKGTSPLMDSTWPKFRRDLRNTGCAAATAVAE